MSNTLVLYPSNWFYNAGVIGLLKVFERCDEDVENFLKDDGSVEIFCKNGTDKLFKKWDEMTKEKLNISYLNKKGGTQKYYYANQTENSIKKKIERLLLMKNKKGKSYSKLWCYFCGDIVSISSKKDYVTLSQGFGNILMTSEKTFPNSYWNNLSSIFVCPKCDFILMCHHISLLKLSNNSHIFINAPSFKVMWYLNKFAEKIMSKNNMREILGISLMEFAQRVFVTLGAWSIMNIEMIIKRGGEIEYYSLPNNIAKILLQKDIASLISETGEPVVLDIILNGKFDHLLNLSHKILKYALTGSNAYNDKYLQELRNRDFYSLKSLSRILPELYVKINSIINSEVIA